MRRDLAASLMSALVLAGAAHAQESNPARRQTLTSLAYALGESHALRQLCEGANDQHWRSWMWRLLETEAPDDGLERRMRDSFNTGYHAALTGFPECDAAAQAAGRSAAARGRALSRQLGHR